jgi:hypothetical protein
MLEFTHPDMLAGLLIIALCVPAALIMARRKPIYRRVSSIGLPLLAGALSLCAAAGTGLQIRSPAKRIIVALDQSPAAITAPWHNPQWLKGFLQRHLPAHERVTLVGFARRVHVIASMPGIDQSAPWPHARLISHHSASTQRLLEYAASKPCWIFTTGLLRWNLPGDHIGTITPLAVTLIPPVQSDAGITNLQLDSPADSAGRSLPDQRLAIGPIEVTARATGPIKLTLEELLNDHILARMPVHFLQSGIKVVRFPVAAANVRQDQSELSVVMQSNDPWPGDNEAHLEIPGHGQRNVLMVTRHSAAHAIAAAGWNITEIPPGQVPVSVSALSHYQVVVLDNIATGNLRPGVQQSLSNDVQRTGGGLLIIGTTNAFGPGGYGLSQNDTRRPSTLELLSPLSCLPPHQRPQNVVFLLDASGSMGNSTALGVTRFALAAHAITLAAHMLKPHDRISILLFAGKTRELISGTAKMVVPRLPGLLARVAPDGPTRPNSALPVLQNVLRQKALLVLITDGRIPHLNIPAWKKLLLQKAIRFTVIAPRQSSPAVNKLLTATAAIHDVSTHFTQWAAFLHHAVARHLGGITQTAILHWHSAPMKLHGNTHQWDRVYLKRSATMMASSQTHALAALWRRGLGSVAAIAFRGGKQAEILRGKLLDRVSPPAGDRRFTITAERRQSHWLIHAHGSSRGVFLNNLHLGLTIIEPHKAPFEMAMAQTAPGTYQTRLPRGVHTFSAAVWQQSESRSHLREHLIGHITPPWLPDNYFPATGRIQRCPWKGIKVIPAHAPATLIWNPDLRGRTLNLTEILWALSTMAAMGAIIMAWRAKQLPY